MHNESDVTHVATITTLDDVHYVYSKTLFYHSFFSSCQQINNAGEFLCQANTLVRVNDENGEQLVPPTNNTSKRQKKDGTTIIMLLCTTMLVLGDSLMLSCMYLTMEDIINNSEHAMSRKVNTLREDWSAHNDRLSEQMFLLVLNEKGMF